MKNKWSDQDKQAFKDRNVLKAKTVPPKRPEGPSAKEWLERTDIAQQDFDRRTR